MRQLSRACASSLRGRVSWSGELPFGVVRQLFEPLLAEPEAAALLAGPAAPGARPLREAIPHGNSNGNGDGGEAPPDSFRSPGCTGSIASSRS